jgi:hypothetical protein
MATSLPPGVRHPPPGVSRPPGGLVGMHGAAGGSASSSGLQVVLLHGSAVRGAARRLRDAGCCGLCVLRLVGISPSSPATSDIDTVEAKLDREVGGARGGTITPAPPPPPPPPVFTGSGPRPGDWVCPACGCNNFASKVKCFKCKAKKPRPEVPPSAASDGPGAGAAAAAPSHHALAAKPQPPPNTAKKMTVFVSTEDASLFTGAKLVAVRAATLTELVSQVAAKVGGPECPALRLRHEKALMTNDSDLLRLDGSNRLVVEREPTTQTSAAAPAAAAAAAAVPSQAAAAVEEEVTSAAEDAAAEAGHHFTCSACLGALQYARARWCAELEAQIERSGFEYQAGQSCLVGVSLPSDCLVRQRLLLMAAAGEGGTSSTLCGGALTTSNLPPPVDLKRALQDIFYEQARATLACVPFRGSSAKEKSAALELQLSWQVPPLSEAAAVASAENSHVSRPKKRQRHNNSGNPSSGGKQGGADIPWNTVERLLAGRSDAQLRAALGRYLYRA